MVLRVANARALVIDLRRLQLGFVIYNLYNGLQLELTRLTVQLSKSPLQFPVHFLFISFLSVTVGSWISKPLLGSKLAQSSKSYAQCGEYFDAALKH